MASTDRPRERREVEQLRRGEDTLVDGRVLGSTVLERGEDRAPAVCEHHDLEVGRSLVAAPHEATDVVLER